MKNILKNSYLYKDLKIITSKINSVRKIHNLYYTKKQLTPQHQNYMNYYKDHYKQLYQHYKETKKIIMGQINELNLYINYLNDEEKYAFIDNIFYSQKYHELDLIYKEYNKIDERYVRLNQLIESINNAYDGGEVNEAHEYMKKFDLEPQKLSCFMYCDSILQNFNLNCFRAIEENSPGLSSRIKGILYENDATEEEYDDWLYHKVKFNL